MSISTSRTEQYAEMATSILSRDLTNGTRVSQFEIKLDDSIEIRTGDITGRLAETGKRSSAPPDFIQHIKLALLYHEAAVKTLTAGVISREHAAHSHSILTTLKMHSLLPEASPLISAYEASASSLIAIEKGGYKDIQSSLGLFRKSIALYSHISLLPDFLRARIAGRLPWYFFRRDRRAADSFRAVIKNTNVPNSALNERIRSFALFELASISAARKQYYEAIDLLTQSIAADVNRTAAAPAAEKMKNEFFEKHLVSR